MFNFFNDLTPMKAITAVAAAFVMLIVWVLNAVFTFTYGMDIIGPFLLESQLGPDGSALLSGLVAFVFYDLAYTTAFMVLLFSCRSVWQYAITGIQFGLCFLGSVLASTTSILILSPLGNEVPEVALLAARYISYGGIVGIFVVNALATVGYIATRPEMAAKIQESIHEASQTADIEKFTGELHKQSRHMAKDLVRQDLPALAAAEAAAIRSNFVSMLPDRTGGAVNPQSPLALPAPDAGQPLTAVNGSGAAPAGASNGASPDEYIVYRRIPGRGDFVELTSKFSYKDAMFVVSDDSLHNAPGTKYKISAHGQDISHYEIGSNRQLEVVNPVPLANGRLSSNGQGE